MAAPQGIFAGSLPEIYERFLVVRLFRPFAEMLLERARISEQTRLLDVACGTGIVARVARETIDNRGRVVGVDLSPGMLAMARSVAPAIDWREGDATHLPIGADEAFDVVTCHQGLQFIPDKLAAVREMRRVTAPGGRVAIATWLSVDDLPLMRDLQRIAERHLGPFTDLRHCFGDADAVRRLLVDAGFHAIDIGRFERTVRLEGGAEVFARLNAMAVVGMSAAAKAMSEEQRAQVGDAIVAESVDALRPYVDGGELLFHLISTVAIAQA